MNYTQLKLRIENSVALKLLRADSAPLCLGFLQAIFREDRAITRTQFEVVTRLTIVLDEINSEHPHKEPLFPREAKYYIDKWVADRALITRFGDREEILYELSPEADQAILFLDKLAEQRENTRGAQSKLRIVIERLKWIQSQADPDLNSILDDLDRQINELRDRKLALLGGAEVQVASGERLLEEYQFARDTASELLADFSRIRQRFLRVAQDLAEQYASRDVSRGRLLEMTLDAHKELHTGQLGLSFAAFREYLSSSETQVKLHELIRAVAQLPQIAEAIAQDRFLQRMQGNLISEAKSVIEQTRRLSSDLRRMLDTKAIASRRETREILQKVQAAAYALCDEPPESSILELRSIGSCVVGAETHVRSLWRAPEEVEPLPELEAASNEGQEAAAKMILSFSSFETERLKDQIEAKLESENHGFRLQEMLDWYPPKSTEWLLDVMGYLEVASASKGKFVIKSDADEKWNYTPPDSERSYLIPQVYFYR